VKGSDEMMPSLDDQAAMFVTQSRYWLEPISRGDIVVFRYPRDPSKSYIKRVIGAARDRIRIDSGKVCEWGSAGRDTFRQRMPTRGLIRRQ